MTHASTYHFSSSNEPVQQESLKVNARKGRVVLEVNGFNFIDKDTKQFVIYIPSLNISGYGETKEKADEMIKESFDFFCSHLISLDPSKMNALLATLGWHKKFFAKQFSKLYVDEMGELKNFNAENNHIERFALTAA
ncbi:MAG: hypothetical protein ACOYVG_04980 [Bacteroidota bacterium]